MLTSKIIAAWIKWQMCKSSSVHLKTARGMYSMNAIQLQMQWDRILMRRQIHRYRCMSLMSLGHLLEIPIFGPQILIVLDAAATMPALHEMKLSMITRIGKIYHTIDTHERVHVLGEDKACELLGFLGFFFFHKRHHQVGQGIWFQHTWNLGRRKCPDVFTKLYLLQDSVFSQSGRSRLTFKLHPSEIYQNAQKSWSLTSL